MLSVSSILQLCLPCQGTVNAGWPSPAEEELGDTLTFNEWLIPHKENSVLATVETNLLQNRGILPGDIVVLERGRKPQNEDIVVAKIGNKITVRQYRTSKKGFSLAPPPVNNHEAIYLIGVVTAVIRKYR